MINSSAFVLAQEAPTRWAPIEKSMTALLNEGWRIISYSSSTALPDVFFTFLLSRESKVVICIVDNPRPNNAISRCRALNQAQKQTPDFAAVVSPRRLLAPAEVIL